MTGVILAGGQSSRMGRAKAGIPVAGVSLIRRVYEVLDGLVDQLLVVVAHLDQAAAFSWPEGRYQLVTDTRPGLGPLAGIQAALAASGDTCLVAACDMPLISQDLARHLIELAGTGPTGGPRPQGGGHWEAVVPLVQGRLQPLLAVYAPACLDRAEARLAAGELSLHTFIESLVYYSVTEAECRRYDPDLASFTNINTECDLEGFIHG